MKSTSNILTGLTGNYNIKENYKLFSDSYEKKFWAPQVWTRLSIPKYRFILWLVVQDCLKTKQRLHRMHITTDANCVICGNPDLAKLEDEHYQSDTKFEVDKSSFGKNVMSASLEAIVYQIWHSRNEAL
ncbi:unnamed protein product [Vicia faba]|uniref:Reverse transcriptase zinc-binding domain-containing protein n=1 Tax=Vicia faba TaxID=3906 RepID=A0AAV0YTI1_VICFA|nr:unnamed protein product [Vicia faba]